MESYSGTMIIKLLALKESRMPTPLEKALKDPDSMKARILSSARVLFAEYGYHGVTTRMIAKEVGIDISTLHYHWGDKENLYEAVITVLNDELEQKLKDIEKVVRGKTLSYRLEVTIDTMCDYLFENPSVAKLVMSSHFLKTRSSSILDQRLAKQVSNIAIAMRLDSDKQDVSPKSNAKVLAISNLIYGFTSGGDHLQKILKISGKEYVDVVKDTLKFILIPAFAKEQ